jgi:integrase
VSLYRLSLLGVLWACRRDSHNSRGSLERALRRAHLRDRYFTVSHQAGLKASAYEDSGLVFATGKGTPFDTQNIINRHSKPLLESAGLPCIRFDDLQHTCFTILLARGMHPKYVQHLAGHAGMQLSLDRYSPWMPSMGRDTADAMDEALG